MKAVQHCESPIEEKFARALTDGFNEQFLWNFEVRELLDIARLPLPDYPHVYCSPQVNIANYRVDFLFVIKDFSAPDATRLVAVECDGHDWHEKTKEQAARDRKRDRRLAYFETMVLRFTGSEIHRDAHGCAAEAMEIVEDILSMGVNNMYGHEQEKRRLIQRAVEAVEGVS